MRKGKTPLPKLIQKYYSDLSDLAHQNVMYEMGARAAFHALLAAAGKDAGWTLIAEHEKKVNGKTIRPDGSFKDQMNLVRGYFGSQGHVRQARRRDREKAKARLPAQ
jgi:hypothetical protein